MIRKLRIKLIIASMVSLLAVLLVIMSAVNIVYYRQVIQDADSTLALLAANNGFFPKPITNRPPMSLFLKKSRIYRPSFPTKHGISLSRFHRTAACSRSIPERSRP